MSSEQTIVKVGAEGGKLRLYGSRNGKHWTFGVDVYDWTPLEMTEDEDGGTPIQHRSAPVTSWADAIAAFDRYR